MSDNALHLHIQKHIVMSVRLALALGLLSWLSYSCSTDITLEAEWKDIPVVYGILNLEDTAHYVRVEKAFLEPGGNALEIAQNPDSIYYDDARISVELERVSNGERFRLERVDGNLEGYPREEGPFASAPNYLYKIRSNAINLQAGEEIRFVLNRGDDLEPATATTAVLDSVEMARNRPGEPLNLLPYERNVTWLWRVGDNAALFDVRMTIRYLEQAPGQSEFVEKELEWVLDKQLERSDFNQAQVVFTFQGEDFYRFLNESVEADGSLRQLIGLDFKVVAIGREYTDFLEVANANLGITGAQNIPVFSNIENGQGLFTSRSDGMRIGLTLGAESVDSLRNGVFTEDLNFFQ